MRLFLILLAITGSFIVTTSYAGGTEEKEVYQVWYIPLDDDFYTPVTPENIEERATKVIKLSSSPIDLLFSELAYKKKIFPTNPLSEIRIKIKRISDKKILYIHSESYIVEDSQAKKVETILIETIIYDIKLAKRQETPKKNSAPSFSKKK